MIRGFTLIETIIYLALLSVLITGAIESISSLQSSTAADERRMVTEREGDFVIKKMQWSLRTSLDSAAFHFDAAHHAIEMKEGSGAYVPITSANVHADSLSFSPITDADGDTIGTDAAFMLDSVAFDTHVYFP